MVDFSASRGWGRSFGYDRYLVAVQLLPGKHFDYSSRSQLFTNYQVLNAIAAS
ncbi:hypothetical protein [Kamptonema sp. UHCC 0994]|uniref:hypothetical protein n=1 Tax=Kamptonema sp. UHCC 0994 TaxID=3031329 RepID=UPI0023BA303C|nr:hypothetical protein [Kamptonema sp. UHCC 0994]MDF0551934.1 hypothetical protein [Kamptonema sp. UHCC 0994]